MAQPGPVVVISGTEGLTLSNDGRHALLSFQTGGAPLRIAVPVRELQRLLLLALGALGPKAKERRQAGGPQWVAPAEKWEFGVSQNGRHLVLSFRLRGGTEVTIATPRSAALPMSEVLQTIAGVAIASVPPGTIRQ